MKHTNGKGKVITCIAALGFVGFSMLLGSEAFSEADNRNSYDNQGSKIFEAVTATPDMNLSSDSGGRNLVQFYELRQYPGSPPRIPHEVDITFSGNETDCLSCHARGGYSPEFGKFTPVTPHPENTLCYQCHTEVTTTDLFVETDWKSVETPRLGRSFISSSPPPVPHTLQLRENCVACHTGPGAVAEIRVQHAMRGDCRQCHAVAVQTSPLQIFQRD